MTVNNIILGIGEDLNISIPHAQRLLDYMVYCLRDESRLTKTQIIEWFCVLAENDWNRVVELFRKARDGEAELKEKKNAIEAKRAERALYNSLRGIVRFYLRHKN